MANIRIGIGNGVSGDSHSYSDGGTIAGKNYFYPYGNPITGIINFNAGTNNTGKPYKVGLEFTNWNYSDDEINSLFGEDLELGIKVVGTVIQTTGVKSGQSMPVEFLLEYYSNFGSIIESIEIDSIANPIGYPNYFTFNYSIEIGVPVCDNVPDGQAAITLIYEELGTGQKSNIQRSFDFRDSMVYVNFFNYWNNFPGDSSDFVIIGYRVKASKGFTHGTVRLLEGWSKSPSGSLLEKVKDRGTIQLTSGETDGFLAVQDYSRSSVLEGIPEYLTGHVTLECNFAVPECVDETYQGLPDDDETYIQTTVFNTVDESIEIHITDGEGLTEELTKIDEPIPPDEPESGCECEKYQAKLIYEGLKYIQKTLDVRLSQMLIAQNEANKRLVVALVSGLQPLVTTEEEPRGIADVLNKKEFDPFIMVDTNEAFYKKLMPPEGNAWIGDMP